MFSPCEVDNSKVVLDPRPAASPPTYENYLRRTSLEGLRLLVWAAAAYFAVASLMLCRLAPSRLLGWLLLQKGIYLVLALVFTRHLKRGKYPLERSGYYVALVLVMCLSSAIFTAWAGLRGSFSAYSAVLLLGISMVEVCWRRAALFWSIIWMSWLWVYCGGPINEAMLEFSKLIGVQLIAIPALGLHLRINRRQYLLVVRLEDALAQSERARLNLDAAVEERTKELNNAHVAQVKLRDQLIQSQKMESLGRLAGGVAHDFNNFLTVILGNLDLIRATSAGGECLEFVKDAETAVERAVEVTGQLLAFSRKEVLQIKPFNLQAAIQDSLRMVRRLLGEDIRLLSQLQCPDIQVNGDSGRIQQVLLNLVVNARDAMPTGGELLIELFQQAQSVVLRVTDNGCGMEKDTQLRVLEPFFTTKPAGHGTGLGLSTVDGIVSMHQGKLSIDSELGVGTTVSVMLPIASVAPSEVESSGTSAPYSAAGERILLVEDDELVRGLVLRVLSGIGYVVLALESASQALALLSEDPRIDLIVTDVVMPNMDGGSLAQAVATRFPHIPVLFISGYTDDRLANCGVTQAGSNFLPKPFTPVQLRAKIAEILQPQALSKSSCDNL